ncbi:MAG: hypothetical protein AAF840_17845, partial [Bacteroidota bacterium]
MRHPQFIVTVKVCDGSLACSYNENIGTNQRLSGFAIKDLPTDEPSNSNLLITTPIWRLLLRNPLKSL